MVGIIGFSALEGQTMVVQAGSFVACSAGVGMDVGWQGFKNLLSGESMFWLRIGGTGRLILSSYGAIYPVQVNGEYIVDTSHLVAYEPQMKLKLQLAGGLFSSLFGGEGFVTRVEGKGKIVIQTRSLSGLANWLNPRI